MQNQIDQCPYIDLKSKADLEFDYQTNKLKVENKTDPYTNIYYFDKKANTYKILKCDEFQDSSDIDDKKISSANLYKACILKRLVSKKKRRYQTEEFDLDLAYITKRIIAMGYPATGCEASYRNSIIDVLSFFEIQHKSNIKVFNLCIEKDRIYDKNIFRGIPVGFFPSKDHNPCPIKLILEFCTDISLFFIQNPESVAAIHCKAGKGRTGVMICCYLIFSGICKNTDEALMLYGNRRTYNKKGVTIASQVRYIQYFETFLMTNFAQPYVKMIPKIVNYYINVNTTNMIKNYINDLSYFITPNSFYLNRIKIGPFTSSKTLNVRVQDFLQTDFKEIVPDKKRVEKVTTKDNQELFYFIIEFQNKFHMRSDIKISVSSFGIKFYFWCNLWYSALDLVKLFIDDIHMEGIISRIPNRSVHPKLRLTSSIYHKKIKINKKANRENLSIEMTEKKNGSEILKEELIDSFERNCKNYIKKGVSIQEDFMKKKGYVPEPRDTIETNNSEKEEKEECSIDKIYEIIDSLNHNTDLNVLIDTINNVRMNERKPLFKKNNLHLSFNSYEVDKFTQAKKMHPDFAVDLYFELLEKDQI